MEFRGTAEEVAGNREIWENVTRVLVSLPVTSLEDVDQLSSVLTQLTVRMLLNFLSFHIVMCSIILKKYFAKE